MANQYNSKMNLYIGIPLVVIGVAFSVVIHTIFDSGSIIDRIYGVLSLFPFFLGIDVIWSYFKARKKDNDESK